MTCEVMIELKAKNLNQTFTYLIPTSLLSQVKVGQRVKVPFGKREIAGFVVKINNYQKTAYNLKPIIEILDQDVILNHELTSLVDYLADLTLCSKAKATETILPKGAQAKLNNIQRKTQIFIKSLVCKDDLKKYLQENKLGINQVKCLELLITNQVIKKSTFPSSTYQRLLKDKIIIFEEQKVTSLNCSIDDYPEHELNTEQKIVYQTIKKSLNTDEIFLIHGVTGSGKTEIYLKLISDVLNQGKTAIVLVPEISLTPQITSRFSGRFKTGVITIHSKMTSHERLEVFERIKSGEIKVVIGPRSAIFAPFENLGIIIIDEEHESSYKQQNNPRYHALDIAKFRSNYHQIPIILGSATPSLESMARAKKGVYKLLTINNRVNNNLPDLILINKNKDPQNLISKELIDSINKRLLKKEQVILLLNRRGYNTISSCASCGHTLKCPDCDITLTYHLMGNIVKCHYCGYQEPAISHCPSCQEPAIRRMGTGTQKLELTLKEHFKDAKILRMDQDTTSKKGKHQEFINDFSNEEYDILLGTQMIAKGLDFPNVTLVGVINADLTLNIPDFRSAERTFQLLSQVSGRSGRGDLKGEVIIETFNPDHYVLKAVKSHDYEAFYQEEMNIRRILQYPPYVYLIVVKFSSLDEVLINKERNKTHFKENNSITLLGPSSVTKINQQYSFRYIIKYKDLKFIKPFLKELQKTYQTNQKINIDFDFNPLSL